MQTEIETKIEQGALRTCSSAAAYIAYASFVFVIPHSYREKWQMLSLFSACYAAGPPPRGSGNNVVAATQVFILIGFCMYTHLPTLAAAYCSCLFVVQETKNGHLYCQSGLYGIAIVRWQH